MHVTTQRHAASKQFEVSTQLPPQPWDRPVRQAEALAQTHVDEVDGRKVHWIPGLVLIVVEDEPQLEAGLSALDGMLRDGTTSLGVVLVGRDVPLKVDHAALSRRRMRAITLGDVRAHLMRSGDTATPDGSADPDRLADRYLQDLGRQTRDRVQGRGAFVAKGRPD